MKKENRERMEALLQENERQEALMVAKHDGEEREARKADELKTERNASAPSQLPQIPECPVSDIYLNASLLIVKRYNDGIFWINWILVV